MDADDDHRPQLRKELTSFQILFIVLSGLIGTGVFVTDIDALQLAGPGGLLLALGILSIITLSVGDTVSHLVQLFPVPNAIPMYVSTFVDRELAWVIGFSYWYAWTSVFATEMLTAATIVQYWEPSFILSSVLFYIVTPLFLVFINSLRVSIFGWLETFGGILKVLLMLALTIIIYHAAVIDNDGARGAKPINAGLTYNTKYADNIGTALCMALPLVAWGFGGIESTAMAAFEARPKTASLNTTQNQQPNGVTKSSWWQKLNPKRVFSQNGNSKRRTDRYSDDPNVIQLRDIARASGLVHWVSVALYLFYNFAIALTVPWDYLDKPSIFALISDPIHFENSTCGNTSLAVLVPFCNNTISDTQTNRSSAQYYNPTIASFINGFLLYSVISCGNTALYMASRTLYGLATSHQLSDQSNRAVRTITRVLGYIVTTSGVPMYAVVLSCLMFCWVPLMGFKNNEQWVVVADIKQFLLVTGSMAYIVVWAALCLAFIRFWYWGRICADHLSEDKKMFCQAKYRNKYREYIRHARLPQPWTAIVGLAGCFLLIIASSSVWWGSKTAEVSRSWTISVFFLEGILLLFWVLLKFWGSGLMFWRYRWCIHLDKNASVFELSLDLLINAAKAELGEENYEMSYNSSRTNITGAETEPIIPPVQPKAVHRRSFSEN